MLKANRILAFREPLVQIGKSYINTSCSLNAGKLWRQKNGMSKLQTARGPLIDLPDYSFTDGRAVPLSVGQVKRKQLQQRLANDILDGLKFLNQAKSYSKSEKVQK